MLPSKHGIRWAVFFAGLGLVAAGCGSNDLTLGEYAAEVEDAVVAMNANIDSLDRELSSATSVAEWEDAWDRRLAAREVLRDTLDGLHAPEIAVEMHAAAIDIVERLSDAERALGDRAATYETADELAGIWDTPEAQAARAIDEEAVAICQAGQGSLNESGEDPTFGGIAGGWLNPEVRDIVDVVLGCTAAERGTG